MSPSELLKTWTGSGRASGAVAEVQNGSGGGSTAPTGRTAFATRDARTPAADPKPMGPIGIIGAAAVKNCAPPAHTSVRWAEGQVTARYAGHTIGAMTGA
jgi:hypothetical protein